LIHPPPANPGLHKAAILLVVLGEDAASAIYRQLPAEQVERITREIADLRSVDPETALSVLEEFDRMVLTGDYLAQGGRDYANKLLVKAFGEDGAQDLLRQVSHAAEASASRLDSLRKADPTQLAKFIEGEHPQTIALILAHLDSKQASTLAASAGGVARRGHQAVSATAAVLSRDGGTGFRSAAQAAGIAGGPEPPGVCRVARRSRTDEPARCGNQKEHP